MIGEITEHGFLLVFRGGTWLNMFCPYAPDKSYCGQWCPLFGDPQPFKMGTILSLCKKTLTFDKLVDSRGN